MPSSDDLLAWYDRHARIMPWRIPPQERKDGAQPDPYRVWLSEIMLQQTTVAAVKTYFERFTARWPNVVALAKAEDVDVMGEWAGLGYYARARNLLKCARMVTDEMDAIFPSHYEDLIRLPGVGPYTASAVAAIAFDIPATVVDGNVERVMSRLFNIHTPLPLSKNELTQRADTLTPRLRPGDYAQAVMDLGATICTPKRPACGLCPWTDNCIGHQSGTAPELPKKIPKKQKPTRYGFVYFVQREDESILLERRPGKGLLGGMLGWPGSDWSEAPTENPPVQAEWQPIKSQVRHTFTHFHLHLSIMTTSVSLQCVPQRGEFVSKSKFKPSELPTVMRKVFDLVK
jgi:A/G-specific adenine glycosylase